MVQAYVKDKYLLAFRKERCLIGGCQRPQLQQLLGQGSMLVQWGSKMCLPKKVVTLCPLQEPHYISFVIAWIDSLITPLLILHCYLHNYF